MEKKKKKEKSKERERGRPREAEESRVQCPPGLCDWRLAQKNKP